MRPLRLAAACACLALLDGGSSSGLLLRDGPQLHGVDSWVPLPDALLVGSG